MIPADTARLVCPRDEFNSVPSADRMRDMAETTPVTITILDIERVAKGDVVALAIVELEVAGVVIVLQGVAVTRQGRCRAPLFRHPRNGHWLPAVRLPASLSTAVATEVLASVSAGTNSSA